MTIPSTVNRIRVGKDEAASDSYDVIVGRDLIGEVAPLLAKANKVAIIHQPTVTPAAQALYETLRSQGFAAYTLEVPDAEAGKTIKSARFCWDVLGKAGVGRDDVIIGFGGGAVCDVAGFVAATWLRGVRVVHIPTTLLGMVDAAIGGKTGVNIAAGKNLVGVFHAPSGVVVDVATLATLPREDLLSGMAEIVKCGFIADPTILDIIERDINAATDPASPQLREVIERSIRVKADVVTRDFREDGLREMLNYGHTLGHAIEHQQKYTWRHGYAVSVGMTFAAELSAMTCGLDALAVRRHRDILSALGLPVSYITPNKRELVEAMYRDKKVRQNQLRFVGLSGVGSPTIIANPSQEALGAAFAAVVQEGSA